MSEETPNIGGRPDPPPPKPLMMFAGFTVAFQLAAVIVLVGDRGDIATILSVLALVFGAATFFMFLGWSNATADYYAGLAAEEQARRREGTASGGRVPPGPPPDEPGPHGPPRR